MHHSLFSSDGCCGCNLGRLDSLLPICANLATTIGGYTHNAQKIRIATMFVNSPLWIVYNIIIGSWAGVLDEVASEISAMISIYRYGWKNLGEIQD